jgi:hypothetical protein
VHGLVVKKGKHGKHSTFERGFRHQNQAKMNVRILRIAMAMQRRNDQKVASRACAKAQQKFVKLRNIAK